MVLPRDKICGVDTLPRTFATIGLFGVVVFSLVPISAHGETLIVDRELAIRFVHDGGGPWGVWEVHDHMVIENSDEERDVRFDFGLADLSEVRDPNSFGPDSSHRPIHVRRPETAVIDGRYQVIDYEVDPQQPGILAVRLPTGRSSLQRVVQLPSFGEMTVADIRWFFFPTSVVKVGEDESIRHESITIRLFTERHSFYRFENDPVSPFVVELHGSARFQEGRYSAARDRWRPDLSFDHYFVREEGYVTLTGSEEQLRFRDHLLEIHSNYPGGHERLGPTSREELALVFSHDEIDATVGEVFFEDDSSMAPFSIVWYAEGQRPEAFAELSAPSLRLLRKTIYARSGYRFRDQGFQEFFSRYLWYIPRDDFQEELHIPAELRERLDVILQLER